MYRFLLFIAGLTLSSLCSPGSILSGNITSNLSLNGKIAVTGQVTIAPYVTLEFLPGSALTISEGVSISGAEGSRILFSGTALQRISLDPADSTKQWGRIKLEGIGSFLEMRYTDLRAGAVRLDTGATGIFEDSRFRDYYNIDIPIIKTEAADSIYMVRCEVSNYYELNIIRTPALIEDCLFQFMTADGIDFDNSPQSTILRRSTLRYGRGDNIDAIDFGKVSFMGNGSRGFVQQCIIHDISDKAVSVGEGAEEVNIEGNVIYNCGAGVSVKDNSFARIYNNTFHANDIAVELIEKNPGLGGGHGYTYNNIFWNNGQSFYLNSTATVQVLYSNLQDVPADSVNFTISADPLFIDPSHFDFRLNDRSPSRATGFNHSNMGAIFPVGCDHDQGLYLYMGYPHAESVFSPGDTVHIAWSAAGELDSVIIFFSDDNGMSWSVIASGIDASSAQFTWFVPTVYSDDCKIRIVSMENSAIHYQNFLPFTIAPAIMQEFEPVFSLSSGFYDTEQMLSISSQPGDIIYYTMDGQDPGPQSTVYSVPLHLGFDSIPSGQPEQNITSTQSYHQPYSYIRTAPVSHIGPNPTFWYLPGGTIMKANIVKARIYRPGSGLGPVFTRSYFMDPRMNSGRYSFPVFSVVTDPDNLFDYYNGVYIPGADFTGYSFTGNYERKGRASEKPASLEMFEPDGRLAFSKNVGFRIRGEWIRSAGQKALTIFARSEYDVENEFDYELFPGLQLPGTKIVQDEYKRFILRNAGNEWGWPINSMCRDMLIHSLFDRLDVKYQAGRPSIVFLNGEYWGIHNIRELNDHRGLEFSYGVDPDSIIMMEDNLNGAFQLIHGNDGDIQLYNNMRNFILSSDLNDPANYERAGEMIDLDNFIDYWIATIYSNKKNADHNTSYWRVRNPKTGSGVKEVFDGRWRWIANDFENGFDDPAFNNLDLIYWMMKDSLLKKMSDSELFRKTFLSRFADLLNSSFSESHVLKKIDYFHQLLEPEMQEHIDRWGTPASMGHWEQAINNFRVFASGRVAHQFNHLKSKFGIAQTHQLEVDVNNQIMGSIQVNSLRINQSLHGITSQVYPWTGSYFESVPVSISALPYKGYRFLHWKETGDPNPVISLNLNSDEKRTAVFEIDPSQNGADDLVFPNPLAGNELILSRISTVRVFDAAGREVIRTDYPVSHIDMTNLGKGIYYIRLDKGESVKLVRL